MINKLMTLTDDFEIKTKIICPNALQVQAMGSAGFIATMSAMSDCKWTPITRGP